MTNSESPARHRQYNVQIFWRSTKVLSHTIKASSLAEAEKMAMKIKREDLPSDELTGLDGELYIDTVSPINGGQDND